MKRDEISMKDILARLAEFFEIIKKDRTPKFRAEVILVFILTGVIFMTAVYFGYDPNEKAAVSTAAESVYIPDEKPYVLMQIQYNITPMHRSAEDIKYIVVHDTGNTRASADAFNHFNYFNSGNQKASADFFVDNERIIQINDYYEYYTWHCGDGGAQAKINNRNSVGVEICINSDGDYAAAVERAVILVRILMKELDIDINHVVRHHDASGKDCPITMNNHDWKYFLDKIEGKKSNQGYVMSYLRD